MKRYVAAHEANTMSDVCSGHAVRAYVWPKVTCVKCERAKEEDETKKTCEKSQTYFAYTTTQSEIRTRQPEIFSHCTLALCAVSQSHRHRRHY